MIALALILLVAAVLAFHGWTERRHAEERKRLLDAIIARTPAEYAGLRSVDEPPKARTPRRLEEHDFQVGS